MFYRKVDRLNKSLYSCNPHHYLTAQYSKLSVALILSLNLTSYSDTFFPFLCVGTLLQLTGETVGEVKAVADMHQRKAEMAKHSDAFIALPG